MNTDWLAVGGAVLSFYFGEDGSKECHDTTALLYLELEMGYSRAKFEWPYPENTNLGYPKFHIPTCEHFLNIL